MPTSFRTSHDTIPRRYRTPSPPRDAVEPISPLNSEAATVEWSCFEWADNASTRNGLKRPHPTQQEDYDSPRTGGNVFGDPMDVFASIALATKADSLHHHIHTAAQGAVGSCSERPSKRARSEKLPSPECTRNSVSGGTRPATSYEQSPEDRKLEAELLLNFAKAAAKLTTPSPVLPHANLDRRQRNSESTDHSTHNGKVQDQAKEDELSSSVEVSKAGSALITAGSQPPLSYNHVNGMSGTQETPPEPPPTIGPPINILVVDEPPDTSMSDPRIFPVTELSKQSNTNSVPDSTIPEKDAAELLDGTRQKSEGQLTTEEFTPSTSTVSEDVTGEREYIAAADVTEAPPDPALPCDNALPNPDRAGQKEEGDARLKGEVGESSELGAFRQLPEEDVENQSRLIHGALGDDQPTTGSNFHLSLDTGIPPSLVATIASRSDSNSSTPITQSRPNMASAVCTACNFVRNSVGVEADSNETSWISCDACKAWFHFACAGFKSEREVRGVDKFRCRKCKPIHGATTYVRKSSRAHSAIDYAGLHQGVIKTSDERPEHHYIKPIKEGTITFLPETFARMRPELLTAEYFEKGVGMKEPIVIPASLNPRSACGLNTDDKDLTDDQSPLEMLEDPGVADDWFSHHPESETVPDHGQDGLDMVVPQGLTVRQVAELYGPEEKVEVIDVKSQNGENKKWNMRRWADYYENPNNKVVRNVISLEVSQSRLGRLIRRPQIVRDLDLQDSVWPEELIAKGEYPRVQFYCLMSVADCFTDFHIDFGGSSVFYHILKGKKTFLFIPPKEKNLKKYEEWCQSPAQNWTFLGDQTKECYRVDLSEGDTMLIPSGWIHAVWTPEDSLVIGGNFLTRMNFGMQLRVAQVEKATGVARKFRYPHFQKLHWYTALQYLEKDPLPDRVRDLLHAGSSFERERPAHYDFDSWGENSRPGLENYHARYYSQSELDGLPDLLKYLLRTALIDIGSIIDGISADTRNAVKKSIPRGHGEPLDMLKTFAAWCAWKRGNEPIPHWAYPDAVPENLAPDKLSAAATKKLDREAALSAPRRHSARMQSQKQPSEITNSSTLGDGGDLSQFDVQGHNDSGSSHTPKRPRAASTTTNSHRKTACEPCRKRRRACKHKDQVASSMAAPTPNTVETKPAGLQMNSQDATPSIDVIMHMPLVDSDSVKPQRNELTDTNGVLIIVPYQSSAQQSCVSPTQGHNVAATDSYAAAGKGEPEVPGADLSSPGDAVMGIESSPGDPLQARPRHKACNECRKSKVSYEKPRLPLHAKPHHSAAVYMMHSAMRTQSKSARRRSPGHTHGNPIYWPKFRRPRSLLCRSKAKSLRSIWIIRNLHSSKQTWKSKSQEWPPWRT